MTEIELPELIFGALVGWALGQVIGLALVIWLDRR